MIATIGCTAAGRMVVQLMRVLAIVATFESNAEQIFLLHSIFPIRVMLLIHLRAAGVTSF